MTTLSDNFLPGEINNVVEPICFLADLDTSSEDNGRAVDELLDALILAARKVRDREGFDVKGALPQTDDTRIKFVKGWFQNTWDDLVKILPTDGDLIVHYDADIYSSTLFALTKIDSLKRPYFAIFDEFAGHEARALHNYQQAYGPNISFEAKTVFGGYPVHVLCKIAPNGT